MNDLFDEFAEAERGISAAKTTKKATAIRARHLKIATRRANSEAHLKTIIPSLQMNDSVHIISRGDVDSMSYLLHMLTTGPAIDTLIISTWVLAMPDIEEISLAMKHGLIANAHFCLGEIFPNQYTAEYERLRTMETRGNVRVTVARNHSKVMIGANKSKRWYFVIESSANANTNPRIEQTAIHMSRELHDFYYAFFSGLVDIDNKSHLRNK